MAAEQLFKVVLVFRLKAGFADEELRRSQADRSFPRILARQPGFVDMELVKIDEEQTMSVQTWSTAQAWWTALETAKSTRSGDREDDEDEILVSREFFGGSVVATLAPSEGLERTVMKQERADP